MILFLVYRQDYLIYGAIFSWILSLIGHILEITFPDGVTLKTADEHNRWHLYIMMLVKISRLACTGISHIDSAHDCAVYSAMLESLMDGDTLPIGYENENNNI